MVTRSVRAIDPGKTWSGWARFHNGTLRAADRFSEQEILNLPEVRPPGEAIVIIERPVIYPFGGNNVDPEDLMKLMLLVGDLRGFYRRLGYVVELVKPRTWKGTVPKPIHNKRTLGKLRPEELALLPKRPRAKDYDHNMLDAVGLGLWQLERMGQR